MNIALIGHGAMGRMVEAAATDRGHNVAVVVSRHHDNLPAEQLSGTLRIADAVIDFSSADAVKRNVEACLLAGVPLVVGTTGWNEQKDEIEKLVIERGGAVIYGPNFSIGVNLFFRVADFAAELFSRFPDYESFIEEQHHSGKKDAPSGTALKLKEVVSSYLVKELPVSSTRAGKIPGTHRLGFDGPADQILLEHTARSREGFAAGAIQAAEWIVGKKGIFEFGSVMEEVCRNREP